MFIYKKINTILDRVPQKMGIFAEMKLFFRDITHQIDGVNYGMKIIKTMTPF